MVKSLRGLHVDMDGIGFPQGVCCYLSLAFNGYWQTELGPLLPLKSIPAVIISLENRSHINSIIHFSKLTKSHKCPWSGTGSGIEMTPLEIREQPPSIQQFSIKTNHQWQCWHHCYCFNLNIPRYFKTTFKLRPYYSGWTCPKMQELLYCVKRQSVVFKVFTVKHKTITGQHIVSDRSCLSAKNMEIWVAT